MAKIENFDKELEKTFKALRVVPDLMIIGVRKSFNTFGFIFEREFINENLSGGSGLMNRTGSLARSFRFNIVEQKKNNPVLKVWTTARYAQAQEEGATIRAKTTKFLAIPTAAAKTPAGVARFTSPRQVEGLFFAKGRSSGKPFLGKVDAAGGVTAFFVLRESVKLKPRLGLEKAWIKKTPKVFPLLEKEADASLATRFPIA